MSKSTPVRLLLPLALLFALAQAAAAQSPVDSRAALAPLPDSQAVFYVNARRIINEVMPRLMPPAEYQKMLAEAQKFGFDVRGIEYVAVGARLADPAPANSLPEFVVVMRGNFNADTLLALGRIAAGSNNVQTRSEAYGSKTIEVIDMASFDSKPQPPADGEAPAKPKPPTYPEIAVMALDSNTLVAGVPSYVKAVVDAAGGRGAMRASMVDLASRDPQALWSLTVELPENTVDYLKKTGMPINGEAEQMVRWVKQVSLSQGMDALNYSLSAAVLTDAPEHASAFSGLVRMGLLAGQTALNQQAAKLSPTHKDYARTRTALGVLKTLVNRTEGNTLILSATVSQKDVAAIVKQEMARKPAATKPAPRPGRRPRPRRR
ncbi:MAG TPA: hypothetical protein VGB98_26870 [Pyrinomonadaceae bacterium]|jgi:hypothetical protein